MVQTYQPPVMDVAKDTIPELMPIFQFLNSHSNKLYQEGYFLKLNDLDAREHSRFANPPALSFSFSMMLTRSYRWSSQR